MVAFDKKLNRLGYGGGFYDRYISKLKTKKKTLLIGLAFHFKRVEKILTNRYDMKLDFVPNRKKFIKMKILFLGDVIGESGCLKIKNLLPNKLKKKNRFCNCKW